MELSKQLVQMTRQAFRHAVSEARRIEQDRRCDANRQALVCDAFRPFVDARITVNTTYHENDRARNEADMRRYPHLFPDQQIAAD